MALKSATCPSVERRPVSTTAWTPGIEVSRAEIAARSLASTGSFVRSTRIDVGLTVPGGNADLRVSYPRVASLAVRKLFVGLMSVFQSVRPKEQARRKASETPR